MSSDSPPVRAAVLYVEDDGVIRELGVMALEDAGFAVVPAEDGAAALDALDYNADPFCAVVTDVDLGGGPDGWAVAKRAHELDPALPVVYVSGANGDNWKSKGVPNSIMIAKPFRIAQVIAAIASLRKKSGLKRPKTKEAD